MLIYIDFSSPSVYQSLSYSVLNVNDINQYFVKNSLLTKYWFLLFKAMQIFCKLEKYSVLFLSCKKKRMLSVLFCLETEKYQKNSSPVLRFPQAALALVGQVVYGAVLRFSMKACHSDLQLLIPLRKGANQIKQRC